MPKYLLVARDVGNWMDMDLSPAEIEAIINKYRSWAQRVAAQGKLLSGEKLRDGEGRVLKGNGKALKVTDGPHSESKEVIGGFWILEAASYEEAVALASDNPQLEHGTLELREIEEMPH
jgi:hypothetical protein